jgi:hypothetical protein
LVPNDCLPKFSTNTFHQAEDISEIKFAGTVGVAAAGLSALLKANPFDCFSGCSLFLCQDAYSREFPSGAGGSRVKALQNSLT